LESSKSRMQRFEEPHAAREPQFGHPWHITLAAIRNDLLNDSISLIKIESDRNDLILFE